MIRSLEGTDWAAIHSAEGLLYLWTLMPKAVVALAMFFIARGLKCRVPISTKDQDSDVLPSKTHTYYLIGAVVGGVVIGALSAGVIAVVLK
jgi:hypothetical protein